ncbi:hypothetical protein [Roseinatronobacter monicus]|uniref:Uncharacterized protein n=1 Tax=Roseinatronobacter monicus TaxID=393481 RepID=A0A543KBK7_9RHOB|nr:hypothetical protein [Roseinatronobacter monicus]TQM92447.1 hypothetical protein BD293_1054 [Roseinatronobacter monicus]
MPNFEHCTNPRIEITHLKPTWVTSERTYGSVIVFSEICEPVFWVTVYEDEGELVIWTGASYQEAIIAAENAAFDWGCIVHDRVVESGL